MCIYKKIPRVWNDYLLYLTWNLKWKEIKDIMGFSHNANNDFFGGKFSSLGQTKIGKKLEIFIFRVKLTNFFFKIIQIWWKTWQTFKTTEKKEKEKKTH